jgi:tetratricopeptide (TPR) repeat protein
MSFRMRIVRAAALASILGGCAVPPPSEQPPAPEAVAPAPQVSSIASDTERALRERADGYMQQRRWADALVQWELLMLLTPDNEEYREQAAQTRRRIQETAVHALAAAEQARRSGNLDRAVTEYLRVLSVDRENARAAQGLKDIERERARRNYLNRPPRTVM